MIADVDTDSIVYLNGEYLRLGDARVSVLDRGFIFGDGIYDVVPVYSGRPFRMDDHLARLERSLAAVHIALDMDRADWEALVTDLIHRSGQGDCMAYIQVTRGVARRDHAFPKNVTPTVFCMVAPFKRPTAAERDDGLSAVAIPDVRWLRCEIKSVSLLGNVLAKQAAVDAGVNEVIQFRDGFLTEGASTNVWMVKNGTLFAPPRNHLILEGIRYGLMQELAIQTGIAFEARPIAEYEVASADELMITSATREVLPVTEYNGQPVGDGRPGPVYRALRDAYDQTIRLLEQA